jgi:hypothetical protein
MDAHVVTTRDQKPQLTDLIRRLPAMLAGRVPDEHGVAAGFRARIGWSIFSLVLPNFNELGRGNQGADGTKWPPLSPEYLAYQRGPKSTRTAGGSAPGGKDGFLTKEQLKLWKRTYADRLAFYVMREPDEKAKRHAAAVAWLVVKAAGGKTKLHEFGETKTPGVDYQMLVDRGVMRQSLTPGQLHERGPAADYSPEVEQVYRDEQTQMVVGTRVPYAAAHHAAKNPKRRRRLWPEQFPSDWWREILDNARGGIARIVQLFGGAG